MYTSKTPDFCDVNFATIHFMKFFLLRVFCVVFGSSNSLLRAYSHLPSKVTIFPRLRLHLPLMSSFFVPLRNGFNAFLWCYFQITLKRS